MLVTFLLKFSSFTNFDNGKIWKFYFSMFQNYFFTHIGKNFTQNINMQAKIFKNKLIKPVNNKKLKNYCAKNIELKPFLKNVGLIKIAKKPNLLFPQVVIIKPNKKDVKPRLKIKTKYKKTNFNQVCIVARHKSENIVKPITKNCFSLKKKKNKVLSFLYLLLIGCFIGFINGFWGGGGGMVCVPTLTNLLGVTDKKAHATTILIMLPLSIASFIVYMLKGNIQWSTAGVITGGFVLGGVAGALILKKINNTVLRIVFSLVIIAGAIKMLI